MRRPRVIIIIINVYSLRSVWDDEIISDIFWDTNPNTLSATETLSTFSCWVRPSVHVHADMSISTWVCACVCMLSTVVSRSAHVCTVHLFGRTEGQNTAASSCTFNLPKDNHYIIQTVFLSDWQLFDFFSPQLVTEFSQAWGTGIVLGPRKSDVEHRVQHQLWHSPEPDLWGFHFCDVSNKENRKWRESTQGRSGRWREKKGNVGVRERKENSWTERKIKAEVAVIGQRRWECPWFSLWCPHSVPAAAGAAASSHQLNTSHSHFDEINTHTGGDELATATAAPLAKNWFWNVCVPVCVMCSGSKSTLNSRSTAQPSGRKKKSLRLEEGSFQVKLKKSVFFPKMTCEDYVFKTKPFMNLKKKKKEEERIETVVKTINRTHLTVSNL